MGNKRKHLSSSLTTTTTTTLTTNNEATLPIQHHQRKKKKNNVENGFHSYKLIIPNHKISHRLTATTKWDQLFELSKMTLDAIHSATSAYVDELVIYSEYICANMVIKTSSTSCKSTMDYIQTAKQLSETACNFTFSGVISASIFSKIIDCIATCLLASFSSPVTTPKAEDYQCIAENLAVCGFTGKDPIFHSHIQHYIKLILLNKKALPQNEQENFERLNDQIAAEGNNGFWLHMSNGLPLLRLWKHSASKKKLRSVSSTSRPGTRISRPTTDAWENALLTLNLSKPLVVNLGCGYGVSLIGLAKSDAEGECNYIGCDLSYPAVAYASTIANRWGLSSICRFIVAPVEVVVSWLISSYSGPIRWVMIEFPTPYKLLSNTDTPRARNSGGGNTQLPTAADGFMVSKQLLQGVLSLVGGERGGGGIYVQSNVEDVAVRVKRDLEALGSLQYVNDDDNSNDNNSNDKSNYMHGDDGFTAADTECSRRWLLWRGMGGEAAEGDGWLKRGLFGRAGRTETEARYEIEGKPVYRIAWRLPS